MSTQKELQEISFKRKAVERINELNTEKLFNS